VDVGCGTGSTALAAAARGARVVGVDAAARLLALAREQAAASRVDTEFVAGAAAQLPVEDGGADVVLVRGDLRPRSPRGRGRVRACPGPGRSDRVTAWLPDSPVVEMSQRAAAPVRDVLCLGPGPAPFAGHDEAAIAELLPPTGSGSPSPGRR